MSGFGDTPTTGCCQFPRVEGALGAHSRRPLQGLRKHLSLAFALPCALAEKRLFGWDGDLSFPPVSV